MARDFQKQRVYESEWMVEKIFDTGGSIEILGSTLTLPPEIKFSGLDAIETYVRRIESSDWYQAAWPGTPALRVVARQSRSTAEHQRQGKAHYQWGAIHIPVTTWARGAWAMREFVVLHEIAHHLSVGDHHGPRFTGALIHLVTNAIGPEAGMVLADVFRGNNVQITYVAPTAA